MSRDSLPTLVIVDGYSSGAALPALMAESGWRCVHVAATANTPSFFLESYRPDDYACELQFGDNLSDIISSLQRFKPKAVVPGTESGVLLADRIAAELRLPGNDPSTSKSRRDKFAMIETVAAADLKSPDQYLAQDLDGLLDWAQSGSWPVVLKPRSSAGTDDVHFCHTPDELTSAFCRVNGAVNRLGERNQGAVAQRLLVGQEFYVNAISADKQHVVTEVWQAHKTQVPDGGAIYDVAKLVDPASAKVRPLVEYVKSVLEVLGVHWGASHTEVMWTDDGPVLIESASRLCGGINRTAIKYAVGASQTDLLARLIVEGPDSVQRLSAEGLPLINPLWNIAFRADNSGVLRTVNVEGLLSCLKSRAWVHKAPEPGDHLQRTIDLFSSPGHIYISHKDVDLMAMDVETVRHWEKSNRLFVFG